MLFTYLEMLTLNLIILTIFVNYGSSSPFNSFSYDLVNNNEVRYKVDPNFLPEEKDYLQKCFKEINLKSCLEWKELPKEENPEELFWIDLVRTDEADECSAFRSYFPNKTKVTLSPHCFQDGWVVRELMHALGFDNEQRRRDRDCYVEVHSSKWTDSEYSILPSISITDFPYDIHSVLHSRRGSFLIPAQHYPDQNAEFGSKDVLTEMDEWKLNYVFCKGPSYCHWEMITCDSIKEANLKKGCAQINEYSN